MSNERDPRYISHEGQRLRINDKALQDIADGCAPMTARDVILALAYAVNDYNRDKVL